MRKKIISSTILALVIAGMGFGGVPAQAASLPSCEPSSNYDIDANGFINFHPIATCYGSTHTIAIYASTPGQTTSTIYTNKKSGTYPGVGISMPYSGHHKYCIVVNVVWTSNLGLIVGDKSSRNCVVR